MSGEERARRDALDGASLPRVVGRGEFEAAVSELRVREKKLTRETDTVAAARRRLPMVEVDAGLRLLGKDGPTTLLGAFEGRRLMLAYYFMWWPGRAAEEQCEGCTYYTNQVREISALHSRDLTFAVLSQGRNTSTEPADEATSYAEGLRYRDFMGWTLPWYSAQVSLSELLPDRELGLFHLVSYLRDGDRVFETYWTKGRGVQAMDLNYALMDLTAWGRQESWEDSPPGWPQECTNVRTDSGAPTWDPSTTWQGRPVGQWDRLAAGFSDDLGPTTDTSTVRFDATEGRCH